MGTKPILVRVSEELANELDYWAEQEGISRNTLVGRELATVVMEKRKRLKSSPDIGPRLARKEPNELKEGQS